jgi:hypothetical protein
VRVFIDTNILLGALVRPHAPAGVLISLATLKEPPFAVMVAAFVVQEAQDHLRGKDHRLLPDLERLLVMIRPQFVRLPTLAEVVEVTGWIRHLHDQPVVASAMISPRPDVVVSDNRKDFTKAVANRMGIPICSAKEFLSRLTVKPFG